MTPVEIVAQTPAAPIRRTHAVFALLLLTAVYTCHAADRAIISVVLQPVKLEFHVSDKILGSVSLAYSLAFILAAIPLGSLIDRVRRVRLLALLLCIWSVMTAGAGAVTGIGMLVVARMGVGAAEAGGQPIALSLLADIFPPNRRASALGVFYLATGLGAIAAFLGGGYIAGAFGWRQAFLLGGVPGLLLAPVLFFGLPEPIRGAMDPLSEAATTRPPVQSAIRFALTTTSVRTVLLAILLSAFVLGSFVHWVPAFLMRAQGYDIKTAGMWAALSGGVMPALGAVLCGSWADRLGRLRRERVGLVSALAMIVMAAAGVGFVLGGPITTIVCLMVFGICGGGWIAPALALLLDLTPPLQRGSVMALGQIFAACGSGIGPFVVGWLSDSYSGLAPALACSSAFGLAAAILYLSGIRAATRRE